MAEREGIDLRAGRHRQPRREAQGHDDRRDHDEPPGDRPGEYAEPVRQPTHRLTWSLVLLLEKAKEDHRRVDTGEGEEGPGDAPEVEGPWPFDNILVGPEGDVKVIDLDAFLRQKRVDPDEGTPLPHPIHPAGALDAPTTA